MRTPSQVRHSAVVIVALVLVSALMFWAVSSALLKDESNVFVEMLGIFYLPVWLVVMTFFGGVHGAPEWSSLVAMAVAILGQNLLLWWGVNKVVRRAKAPREP